MRDKEWIGKCTYTNGFRDSWILQWEKLMSYSSSHKNIPQICAVVLCAIVRLDFGENWLRYNGTTLYQLVTDPLGLFTYSRKGGFAGTEDSCPSVSEGYW